MEYIFIWLLFGIVAAAIASGKGRSGCGWFLIGALLGPFSLVVALMPSAEQKDEQKAVAEGVSDEYRKCPMCAEAIRKEAVKCRYCGSEISPVA